MGKKILIISNEKDATVEMVTRHLENMGETFYRFNTDRFPVSLKLSLSLSADKPSIVLEEDGLAQTVSRAKSVWYRRPTLAETNPNLPEEYNKFIEREVRATLWSLYTALDAFWVNPPLTGHHLLEHNKILQLKTAAHLGLDTPETIITNDSQRLLTFAKEHGGIVAVKTIASHFYATKEKEEQAGIFLIYTKKVSEKEIAR